MNKESPSFKLGGIMRDMNIKGECAQTMNKADFYKVSINGDLQNIGRDCHYTDATTSSHDKLAGYIMSHAIGDLYIDFKEHSPGEQWTKVMKALRVHGFKISFSG